MSEAKNDITELRTALFDTMRALNNKDAPMELERAKAINETAQTIINSVKAEYDALKVIGGTGSGFIHALPPKSKTEPTVPGLTVHRMK